MKDRKLKQALVLFSYKSHKRGYIEMLFGKLSAAAEGRQLQLHRGSLSDMHISIKNNRLSIRESLTGKNLSEFDVLYFELWYKAPEQALAAALHAERQGIPYFSSELAGAMPLTKVGELAKLADADIPIPDTFTSSNREILRAFKADAPLKYPVVVKAADGYGGHNNFLVKSRAMMKRVLAEHKNLRFVVQEFIPNNCDYRCLVLGGQIVLVLRRSRAEDSQTHLNNTSQGAAGELVDIQSIPEAARSDVLRAAERLGRSEFAGVDLLIDSQTGKHYILEVNQTPQIEIGAETDGKMAALLDYMEQRAGERRR